MTADKIKINIPIRKFNKFLFIRLLSNLCRVYISEKIL